MSAILFIYLFFPQIISLFPQYKRSSWGRCIRASYHPPFIFYFPAKSKREQIFIDLTLAGTTVPRRDVRKPDGGRQGNNKIPVNGCERPRENPGHLFPQNQLLRRLRADILTHFRSLLLLLLFIRTRICLSGISFSLSFSSVFTRIWTRTHLPSILV